MPKARRRKPPGFLMLAADGYHRDPHCLGFSEDKTLA
jgi:hypothetical protein